MRKSSPQITSARHVDTLTGLSPIVEIAPQVKEKPNTDRVVTVKLKPVEIKPETDGLVLEAKKKRAKDDSGRYSHVLVGNTDVVSVKKR